MIMNRREAVGSVALLLELAARAHANTMGPEAVDSVPAGHGASGQPAAGQAASGQAATPRPPVFNHDLPSVTLDDWAVTVSIVDYPPGRVGAPHRHAGFVLAYVLAGSVIAKISGQGDERVYSTGEMFYEQPGAVHEVSKNASATEPAQLLAMIFAKKGSTLTTPVQRSGGAV